MSRLNHYESPRFPEPEIEVNSLDGIITIASHPFAPATDNDELLQMALRLGLPSKDAAAAKQVIDATGFGTRYWSNSPENKPDYEATITRTVEIGAQLLKTVMKEQKWDDLDVFVDTSAFLPTEINQRILETAGLDARSILTRSYRFACAGFLGALVDLESDPSLRDARVVIGAMEPLSLLVDRTQFTSLETLSFPSIFSDDYAVAAINFNRLKLHYKKIRVQPDGGVIKIRTLYDTNSTQINNLPIPSYYDFPHGTEIFTYNQRGAFLNIPQPEGFSNATMDGIATGLFFGDQTADLIGEILEQMGDLNFLRRLAGFNFVVHPASEPVSNRIAKKLNRAKLIDGRSLPFIMKHIKRANSSSASIVINLQNQIRLGMVRPNAPFFLVAPGIGSAIVAAAGEFC